MCRQPSPYRIFISYSREDHETAELLADILKGKGLEPLWDAKFQFGMGFPDQIKAYIAHSHVFIPLITEQSSARGWVHQEIGYAMAKRVPVLPVCIGRVPGEMLSELHAVVLDDEQDPQETRESLEEVLSAHVIERLPGMEEEHHHPFFESARYPEHRAQMMAEYANEVLRYFKPGILRQVGGLSSMHIPADDISAPVWDARYGPVDRREFHRQCQRNERRALEKHARRAGFRLIVDPTIDFAAYGPAARIVRLQTLIDFLESADKAKTAEVAFARPLDEHQAPAKPDLNLVARNDANQSTGRSLTCVGDWFLAESIFGEVGRGYFQTIFTRHPAYIRAHVESFDVEFERCLDMTGWEAESSRERAIAELSRLVERLSG